MNPPLFSPTPLKKNPELIDPAFEASITTFADAVIEDEKSRFQPGIESFQVHANKIREEIHDSMVKFQQNFQKGYETVKIWLVKHGFVPPIISEENISLLQNKEEYQKHLNEGRALYEILGFSEKDLKDFYKAAYQLTQDKDFVKGRDACFFLVTISPQTADFWFGLAVCATQLKEHDTALDATLHLIELDPKRLEGYLNGVHIYLQKNDIDKAFRLCQKGIDFAKISSEEEWTKNFILALEKIANVIRGG